MTIKIGDSIPAMKIMQGTADGPKEVDTTEFFKGRTVVLFGVPGAFTPTCHGNHVPGYIAKAADLPPDVTPNEIAAWAVVSRVLLNLDETVAKN